VIKFAGFDAMKENTCIYIFIKLTKQFHWISGVSLSLSHTLKARTSVIFRQWYEGLIHKHKLLRKYLWQQYNSAICTARGGVLTKSSLEMKSRGVLREMSCLCFTQIGLVHVFQIHVSNTCDPGFRITPHTTSGLRSSCLNLEVLSLSFSYMYVEPHII
jgi:hypothetical protein